MTAWKMVPGEPTEAMQDAGLAAAMTEFRAAPDETPLFAVRRRLGEVSYKAMLAAAPEPPPYEPSETEVEAAIVASLEPHSSLRMEMRAALIAAEKKRRQS